MTILLNDFKKMWHDLEDTLVAAFSEVGRSGWYILGAQVQQFEQQLSVRTGNACVGVASGLDALEIGLRVSGLCPGDKVLTTPLSAFATTLAILKAGGVPVFADVDASGLLDLDQAAEILAQRSDIRFMMPVHLYGHVMDLERLSHLAQQFGVTIIEDAAQCLGGFWKTSNNENLPVGSASRVWATSFYPTKNLGAMGDAGALFCKSQADEKLAKCIRDYGQASKYEHAELGMNSRLDEVQAAILKKMLELRFDSWTSRRKSIASRFKDEIKSEGFDVLPFNAKSESVWHLFPILVRGQRSDVIAKLADAGIQSAPHYPKLISDQDVLKGAFSSDDTPQAKTLAASVLSLPIHPYLTDDEVTQVIMTVNSLR